MSPLQLHNTRLSRLLCSLWRCVYGFASLSLYSFLLGSTRVFHFLCTIWGTFGPTNPSESTSAPHWRLRHLIYTPASPIFFPPQNGQGLSSLVIRNLILSIPFINRFLMGAGFNARIDTANPAAFYAMMMSEEIINMHIVFIGRISTMAARF